MADDDVATSRRPRFAPVVLVGLAAAGVAALAGSRAWVTLESSGDGLTDASVNSAVAAARDASAPPVTATALVLLAAWGVLLVTRGRVRLAVAWLAVVAALGVLGFSIAVWVVAPDAVTRDLPTLDLDTTHTAWSYLGVLAGVVGTAAAALAVRGVRGWPEMGRRYDAPGASAAEEQTNLDLWRAMDDGRDPTTDTPADTPADPAPAPEDDDGPRR